MQMSPETVQLFQFLKAKHIAGETVTYEEMNKLLGANVQYRKRHWLNSALRALARDEKMHFDCIPKVGYKPMSSQDLIHSDAQNNKIKRTVIRRRSQLQAVDLSDIDRNPRSDDMRRYSLDIARMGIIEIGISMNSNSLPGQGQQLSLVATESGFKTFLSALTEKVNDDEAANG